jgi:YidC/Oxa1 family membrane protein insertase
MHCRKLQRENLMDKKLLLALALSLGTVWVVNYYYSSKKVDSTEQGGAVKVGQSADITPGQPVRVMTSQELHKPLDLNVDFTQTKLTQPEVTVDIQTDFCTASFSTYGAVLTSLAFNKHLGKNKTPLKTVSSKANSDWEHLKKGCFLLALNEQTPIVYTLVGQQEKGDKIEVVFKAELDQWVLIKTYILNKHSYQIDVVLGFEPKRSDATALKPRLLFSSPLLGELAEDVVNIFSWNEAKQNLEMHDTASVGGLAWFWTTPQALFGAEDRYFVHTLTQDASRFTQRAYVKTFDAKHVSSILEGPEIKEKKEWKLSFYMGPKQFEHLNAADSRLEELLSFGWFSWFCKLLLKLLSYLYGLIGNFGLAIILMTILLKLPFAPLSIYARKQMEVYQHYQPAINKIRMKYRQDMQMQHEELMRFYKDHNISPSTHFVGCLPLLIQMPILFSLYRVLNNYLDLYQAPFFGWITDLSSRDPYYVLPIFMGLSMLWQQKMTPAGDNKQRVVMMFMSVIMTVVFANFPAGLVLYWLMNNLLTIAEDYVRKYVFK